MKFRQVVRGGRATLAAAAGTVMVVGGAGAGTAALALSHSAGALSLQAPAIAVREQNVNSAGRIRVALPSGGVGVNGTVAVSNFPKTQPVSGTVNVGNLPTSNGQVNTSSPTPTSAASIVRCGNGTYYDQQILPPLPASETYHLGLVTVLSNQSAEYDLINSSGSTVAAVNPASGTTSVLPFEGLALGAGQGLNLGTNITGCAVRVTADYWISPAG